MAINIIVLIRFSILPLTVSSIISKAFTPTDLMMAPSTFSAYGSSSMRYLPWKGSGLVVCNSILSSPLLCTALGFISATSLERPSTSRGLSTTSKATAGFSFVAFESLYRLLVACLFRDSGVVSERLTNEQKCDWNKRTGQRLVSADSKL